MNSSIIFAFGILLVAGLALVKADEYDDSAEMFSENQYDETPAEVKAFNDEKSKAVVEDTNTETSALVQNDDIDAIKNKGLCHAGIAVWYKPGFTLRCNCLKCTCRTGGKWECAYNFAYCPYFYCGSQIYNPSKQLCCCGKVYTKKANWGCCGYTYYYTKTSKCCSYYTVKSIKSSCPRSSIPTKG